MDSIDTYIHPIHFEMGDCLKENVIGRKGVQLKNYLSKKRGQNNTKRNVTKNPALSHEGTWRSSSLSLPKTAAKPEKTLQFYGRWGFSRRCRHQPR